jgi:catechol 2,3-dioxygenase-like lactoylglutathione lyase family enzyme
MTGVVALDHLLLAMPRGREAEARAFYGELLGLKELTKPSNLASRGGVWFVLGNQQLHLGIEAEFQPARKAHPAFLVRDLRNLRIKLEEKGFDTYQDEPLEGYDRCYVADPFGNRLELMETLAH